MVKSKRHVPRTQRRAVDPDMFKVSDERQANSTKTSTAQWLRRMKTM